MADVIDVRFRLRRDTAGQWTAINPVLLEGEPAMETDTRKIKYGDGVTAWSSLPYFTGGGVTSVGFSTGTTGLSISGSPITGAGTFTLSGTLNATNGGTGFSSYTMGDIVYALSGTALTRLSIGAAASVLSSSGTAPVWTPTTGTGDVVRAARPGFTNAIGVGTAATTSGSGVTFPAAQSPSTDPNTLDDYEEGTWTPTVTSGSGTITTYVAAGYYTKIGRQVHASMVIDITTNGTGAGSINITLPFTSAGGAMKWAGSGRENAVTGSMLQVKIDGGSSSATVFTYNNAYPGASGAQLVLSISYFV
ncbi:hypothetical protein WBP06_09535 [Novosphingobium sp. BL-8H]|uniref:hyaluronate lyase N-terminal domain-containing protein n=1 Tax=Novosphingobium sp. BL-8H TaxID=3127640 RepID=UPI003757A769